MRKLIGKVVVLLVILSAGAAYAGWERYTNFSWETEMEWTLLFAANQRIVELENHVSHLEKQITELVGIIEKYDALSLTTEDIEIIRRISTHILTDINDGIAEDDAVRIAAAIVAVDKIVDVPLHYILALAHTESTFDMTAVSGGRCVGLMQLSSNIWTYYTTTIGLIDYEKVNPVINTLIGASYLKDLVSGYKGNMNHALAHYNSGPRNPKNYRFANLVESRARHWYSVIN